MTIGVKAWAKGASVPGSFTNMEFIKFFMRKTYEEYDTDMAVDGVKSSEQRKYLRVSCEWRNVHDSTVYGTIETVLDAYYTRFDDSRHSGTNTVTMIRDGVPQITREGESEVLKRVVMNFVSESPL